MVLLFSPPVSCVVAELPQYIQSLPLSPKDPCNTQTIIQNRAGIPQPYGVSLGPSGHTNSAGFCKPLATSCTLPTSYFLTWTFHIFYHCTLVHLQSLPLHAHVPSAPSDTHAEQPSHWAIIFSLTCTHNPCTCAVAFQYTAYTRAQLALAFSLALTCFYQAILEVCPFNLSNGKLTTAA